MLDKNEIEQAIAELESGPTTFSNCSKLATLYTVHEKAFGGESVKPEPIAYSLAAAPMVQETVRAQGQSEFMQAVSGKNLQAVWEIIDMMMDNINVVNPKVYQSTIRKIRNV